MTIRKIIISIIWLSLTFSNNLAQEAKSDCICPNVKMILPSESVKAGKSAIFKAQVTDDKKVQTIYAWTVSNGYISKGQGTPEIEVETKGLEGQTLTATVEIGGWCPLCDDKTASASIEIVPDVKPILVDKFTRANCEEVLMRMDNFFIELQNNPDAIGYVIIKGKGKSVATAEREARNWIKMRRFDPSRITLAKGDGDGEKAEIELWLVPPGASPPEVSVIESSETNESSENPASTKPYIFTAQYSDGIGGCDPEFDVTGFAEMLKANPKSRGNVVIYESTQKSFRQVEKGILAELAKSKVARKRIKTFFVKVKTNQLREAIELWLVP